MACPGLSGFASHHLVVRRTDAGRAQAMPDRSRPRAPSAVVVRDGAARVVESRELAPGDPC
jgi:hypothetical protein